MRAIKRSAVSKRFRARGHRQSPDVNIIPLIDVSLMLLIVFMITTPALQNGIKVDLPEGRSQELKEQKQELVVYVNKKGDIFCNDVKIPCDQLVEAVKQNVGNDTGKTVFVKADKAVSYGQVIKIVDDIKYVGGVKYVALATTRVA